MARKTGLSNFLRIFLLMISVFGIWYLIREWLQKKPLKQRLIAMQFRVEQANLDFARLQNFDQYFANRDEQLFRDSYKDARELIPAKFRRIGLPDDYIEALEKFCENFDHSAALRKDYNDSFVAKESDKFADFFKGLEQYPLSNDQIEAIIRDEDNNLVIAGAGTGKTTTISGKIAYLLEKRLARPEELLVISFTKNAVNEMFERCLRFCKHLPEVKDLEVRTFNSFGYLVSRTCSSREILLAFDGHDDGAKAFLQDKFDNLFLNNVDFQRKAVNFLAFFNRPPWDEFEFSTQNDYLVHEQSFKNVTLDGIRVNSKEEMEIGNFFCLFNVNYEYQRHFPLNEEDRNAGYAAYQPDFYLTDHQIWHEHFGIARNGDVPKWFNARPGYPNARDYYHAGIVWKEGIHTKYQTRLIKTYSYENQEGTLISNLKQKLIDEGVELRERTPEELLDLFKKSDMFKDFMNLVHTFLGLMKSNGKSPADLSLPKSDKRSKVFLEVFKPLFAAYDGHLRGIPAIDYNDMINHAAQHFRNGSFLKPYKYILVDEFQDMSLGRYELLKAIRQQNPGVKLYAVGDDWQSIFRFTGSDISIITQFDKQFGVTSQNAVLKSYRFNEQILQTSSSFIQQNPSQIKKSLTAHLVAPKGHISFEFISMPAGNGEHHQRTKANLLTQILQQISELQRDATVFLIGRYKFNSPNDINGLRRSFPGMKLDFYTAHGVKGMTCDYAILVDVDSGTLGFPSEIADDPMLNYLLHEGDKFENAEERRVFYVAITRARYKNYLLYNESRPSKFLLELQDSTGLVSKQSMKCPECLGPVIKRRGPHSEFYGCTHYPRCNGKIAITSTTPEKIKLVVPFK